MTMPVTEGGAYFWLHSNLGDVYAGEAITYSSAVASVAADGAKDVGSLGIPGDVGAPALLPGHPQNNYFMGDASNLGVGMTYDNGIWDDGSPPWEASEFIVELQGPNAADFAVRPGGGLALPFSIRHYVSADGGQMINLESSMGGLFTGLTRIKIWRAAMVPGEPEEPAAPFWTNFICAREVVGSAGPGPGPGPDPDPDPVAGGNTPETAAVITNLPYSTTLGEIAGGAVQWFKVALSAGTYKFHTTDSPAPTDHDTHLALFGVNGALIAENDDIDLDGDDFRSSVTETLAAGTYYVVVGGCGAAVGAGFSFVTHPIVGVPAGVVFKIEAV